MRKRAFFISLEGGEGAGKSTHLKFLAKFLREKGFKVETFREPGCTCLGEKIRRILLYSPGEITPLAELFLYLSARVQFIKEKLKPALEKADIVVSDRFSDSTLVYQGYALNLGIDKIKLLVDFASQGIKPNLTFVLAIDPQKGLKRIKGKKDRIEKRPLKFHKDLQRGYQLLAKREPKRIKVIKSKSVSYVQKKMVEYLEKALKWKR